MDYPFANMAILRFFKSMFLSSEKTCFLRRTWPNTFSWCILLKRKISNFKFSTQTMDLWKNANSGGFWKRCFHGPERLVFYIKRRTSVFHDSFLRFITWAYMGLQGVTGGYKGFEGVTGRYKRLEQVTKITENLFSNKNVPRYFFLVSFA